MRQRSGFLLRNVSTSKSALSAVLYADLVQGAHILSGEYQGSGSVGAIDGGSEGAGNFLGVGRADDIKVRDNAEAGSGFHRLVGRAVFSDSDRVVGEDVTHRQLREGSDTDGGSHVVSEYQESGSRGSVQAVVSDAVEHGAHGVLSDTEVEVAALERLSCDFGVSEVLSLVDVVLVDDIDVDIAVVLIVVVVAAVVVVAVAVDVDVSASVTASVS